MKRVLLFVATLLFVFTLSACDLNSETLECTADLGFGETVTYKYVYNDEKLLKYYVDGEYFKDGTEITEGGETMVLDYDAFVSIAGGIENYIENTRAYMEAVGGTCTSTEDE